MNSHPAYHIRPATRDDVPSILDIYNEAVVNNTCTADYEPQTLDARTAWFEQRTRRNFPIFVAVTLDPSRAEQPVSPGNNSETVVGWSSYGPYHDRIGYRYTVENSIYIAADRRGQGVGKLLLAPLIEHATAQDLHVMIASIDSANEASLRLHAAFGFVRVGYLSQIITKFDRWLDVIYLQKML